MSRLWLLRLHLWLRLITNLANILEVRTEGGDGFNGGSIRPSFLLRSRHGLVLWERNAEQRRVTAAGTATAPVTVTVTVGLAGASVGVGSSWLGLGVGFGLGLWLLGRPSLQD